MLRVIHYSSAEDLDTADLKDIGSRLYDRNSVSVRILWAREAGPALQLALIGEGAADSPAGKHAGVPESLIPVCSIKDFDLSDLTSFRDADGEPVTGLRGS